MPAFAGNVNVCQFWSPGGPDGDENLLIGFGRVTKAPPKLRTVAWAQRLRP